MKIYCNIVFAIVVTITLIGCDEGRIYEEKTVRSSEGQSVHVKAQLKDASSWPSSYTVSIAAFEEGNDYALVTKSVGTPDENGYYDITLSNIPADASSVEICVINRLRQKVASFYDLPMQSMEDGGIEIHDVIDLNMYDVIQRDVFSTTCANCHGGSNFAAADLNLTSGQSRLNLVGVSSTVLGEDVLRVKAGSRSGSLLYNLLTGDISESWNYDHSAEITDYNTLELIGAWIDNGAN